MAQVAGSAAGRDDNPADVGAAWDEALAADRPMPLEMVADPTVPPAPPHITAEQLRHYMAALLQGDPQAVQVVKSSAREWWGGLVATPGMRLPITGLNRRHIPIRRLH